MLVRVMTNMNQTAIVAGLAPPQVVRLENDNVSGGLSFLFGSKQVK